MTIGKEVRSRLNKGHFAEAKSSAALSPGDSLRILRELQGLSQLELSKKCGLPQSTLSAIEKGRVNLGVERAKTLAKALRVHPAVLLFPSWPMNDSGQSVA